MLKMILSKHRHSAGRMLVLLLILILATTFLDTSVQLFIQSIQSAKIIEENTTTLAIEQIVYEIEEVNGSEQLVPLVYGNDIMNKAKKSDAVISVNETNTLYARGEGLLPVMPSPVANYNGAMSQLGTEEIAVFHLKYDSGNVKYMDWGGLAEYNITMRVVAPLALHEGFRVPDEMIVRGFCEKADDPIPFEKGKEYVVLGHYISPRFSRGINKIGKYNYGESIWDEHYLDIGIGGIQTGVQQLKDCEVIMSPDDPRLENLLAIARQNIESFMVTGISQTEGVPLFAMNEAYITRGRDFTREETLNGEKVCLVSTLFAEENRLKIGDTINLSLYRHNYSTRTIEGGKCYMISDMDTVMVPEQNDTFTIVGIYRTMEWGLNKFCFPPSTVFVPRNSLTVQGTKGIDFADSLILKNGSNEEFLQDAKDAGIREGVYTVYDGGYMQFMASLKTMQKDTAIVMLVCFLLYMVITFAALSMMVLHLKKDTEIMLRIGAEKGYVKRYMLLCVLPIICISAICTYAVSCVIHVPLMGLIEKWYELNRPVFSNLAANTQGMLTGNMDNVPLPLGTTIAWLLSVVMICVLIVSERERRTA